LKKSIYKSYIFKSLLDMILEAKLCEGKNEYTNSSRL
jgi:hypothetical protein